MTKKVIEIRLEEKRKYMYPTKLVTHFFLFKNVLGQQKVVPKKEQHSSVFQKKGLVRKKKLDKKMI